MQPQGSEQLELDMPEQEPRPTASLTLVASAPTLPAGTRYRRPLVMALIALSMAAGIYTVVSPDINTATATLSSTFSAPGTAAADLTISKPKQFPTITVPSGQLLQVGLFSRLDGAESDQQRLASLGLLPTIRKRATESGIQYALVIGPVNDAAYQRAVATLKDNNVAFFHLDQSHLAAPATPAYTATAAGLIMQSSPTSDAAERL